MSAQHLIAACLLAAGCAIAVGLLRRNRQRRAINVRLDNACEPIVAFSGSISPHGDPTALRLTQFAGRFAAYLGLGEGGAILNFAVLFLPLIALATQLLFGWMAMFIVTTLMVTAHQLTVHWTRERHRRAFVQALPAYLERTRQFVLIGNTLQQSLLKALTNADPAIVHMLEPMARRVRHGASFTESMNMVARQVDQLDVHMLCACVSANIRFGGKVAQNLSNLTAQINNRLRLQREVRAATAETRASAMALLALTGGVMAYVMLLNREYVAFFLESDTRKLILLFIVGWPVVGLLVMRRLLAVSY